MLPSTDFTLRCCEDVRLFRRCLDNKTSVHNKCLSKATCHREFRSAHQERRDQGDSALLRMATAYGVLGVTFPRLTGVTSHQATRRTCRSKNLRQSTRQRHRTLGFRSSPRWPRGTLSHHVTEPVRRFEHVPLRFRGRNNSRRSSPSRQRNLSGPDLGKVISLPQRSLLPALLQEIGFFFLPPLSASPRGTRKTREKHTRGVFGLDCCYGSFMARQTSYSSSVRPNVDCHLDGT